MNINIALGILVLLINKQKLTATQIAEHFEISRRSVYRYVAAFDIAGISVCTEKGRNGGISVLGAPQKLREWLAK